MGKLPVRRTGISLDQVGANTSEHLCLNLICLGVTAVVSVCMRKSKFVGYGKSRWLIEYGEIFYIWADILAEVLPESAMHCYAKWRNERLASY